MFTTACQQFRKQSNIRANRVFPIIEKCAAFRPGNPLSPYVKWTLAGATARLCAKVPPILKFAAGLKVIRIQEKSHSIK